MKQIKVQEQQASMSPSATSECRSFSLQVTYRDTRKKKYGPHTRTQSFNGLPVHK